MRRYETRIPEPRPSEWCVEVRCDLCGAVAPAPEPNGFDYNFWGKTAYAVDGVTIERRVGDSFPEGGSVEVTTYDICPRCFTTKVQPFLESLGATPRVSRDER